MQRNHSVDTLSLRILRDNKPESISFRGKGLHTFFS